jgi:DNA-binding NarL/FixJ family response regulator
MQTPISIYSTDSRFRSLFKEHLRKYFPLGAIHSFGKLGRSSGDLTQNDRPNLIFVDLSQPNLYSKISLASIKAAYPKAELVVLLAEEKPVQIFEWIQAGATSYLLKDGWQETLDSFLTHLESQQVLISAKVARYLIDRFKWSLSGMQY